MPGSRADLRSLDRSQSKPRETTMEVGEVDGALREARAKIAFLKQQLADLSDAVSYASDGSRDTPLDPNVEGETQTIRSTRFPSSGSSASRTSSKGSRPTSLTDPAVAGTVFKSAPGFTDNHHHTTSRSELNTTEMRESREENRRIDKRNDEIQRPSSAGGNSADRQIVSPFARYAFVDFAQGVNAENGRGDHHQNEVIEDIPEVLSEDDEVFHSSRSSPGPGSSCLDCRSPSPDDSASPQTPVRSIEAGARLSSESLQLDDSPKNIERAYSYTEPQSSIPVQRLQAKTSLQADALLSQLSIHDGTLPIDEDAEFGRDAIAWILSSLYSYMTWPGKGVDQNPFGPIHPSNAIKMTELDSSTYSVLDVSPEAAMARDATARLWKSGAVPIVKKLWELIAGIIESQERNEGLHAKSCWSSGRSLHCAADGLPFAFTVHTFTAPGVPCVVGRANVSAEVCCADAGKSPNCIFQGDEESGSSPDSHSESAPVKRSLSGQLVNGHFITTHDSLEQHPSRVIDSSLDCDTSRVRQSTILRQPSNEIAEISSGYKNDQDRPRRSRRESREETFSFHSESSKASSHSDQAGDVVEHDHLGTADLTAFIRSPEDAPPMSQMRNQSKFLISPIDEFDGSSPDLLRDGATSVGTESGSLSFHHKNATSRISNEQFDTADLSGFITPPADEKLPSVSEAEKTESDPASPQLPQLPPSFGAVDLVWEVRYLDQSGKTTYVIDMKLAPSDSDEDEEESGRTWDTYPGNSDSEESTAFEDSLFSVDQGIPAVSSEVTEEKIVHRKTHSADMEIMRSVSLKGFLANQAEQRKNSRRRMENVEAVAEIESVGSASSKKHVSSPSSRRGRPPLAPTGRIGSVNGEKRADRVPPHSSGSRKEMLTKDKLKQKAQKKGRLPKLSSLVKRMRSFIGSRNTKPDSEPAISTVRAIKSERALSRPDRMLRSSKSGPGPRITQSAKHLRRDTLSIDVEDPPEDSPPVLPVPSTPIDRQLSVESIPVQDPPKGLELSLRNHNDDPNALQDAFYGFPASVSLAVKDLGNGRYLIMGHLAGEGQYDISIKVGGKHIMESPMRFTVVPPRMLGSGITPDGPFYPHPSLPYFPSENTPLSPHPRFPPCHSVSYDAERLDYAYRHPHVGCVDLLLAIDATASMTAEITELPSVVRQLSVLIGEIYLCKRVRFGVIGYRDHWPEDDHSFVLCKLDFTEDVEQVCSFILSLKARGGGDYPEALEAALLEAAEGVSWWPFSSRLVIWVGDAPPHGYEGMGPKQAMEQEGAFLQAKERVKQLQMAVAVDNHAGSGTSSLWTDLDAELSAALGECDKLAMYHDNFPLGIPGGVRWEEASVRLESVGARVIAVGLRDAIYHEPSQACLRSIAHLTGGALLEVGNLHGSFVAPLTAAIIEQQLDKQLIEEEVCDLIICMSENSEELSGPELMERISSIMNDAQKLPHRLQVLPAEVEDSSERSESINGGNEPSVYADGSVSSDADGHGKHLALTTRKEVEASSLWVGMQKVQLRDNHLVQVLKEIRSKAEAVGLSLQAGFGTRISWLEALGSGITGIQGTSSRRVHKRIAEEVLTSPVALRYLLAEEIISKMLICKIGQ